MTQKSRSRVEIKGVELGASGFPDTLPALPNLKGVLSL